MAQPQQYAVVTELATLLRKNGDKILTGESKLTLTTQSLSYLNSAFRRYSEIKQEQKDTNPKRNRKQLKEQDQLLQWRTNVQYLHDFITKTVSLKITHGTATMQGPIFVSRFRGLQVLELRRVPLHMVEGLQKLRGQLQLVVVTRSLQSLQDFFETCGGDMSAPISWPQLKSAYLSYNGFSKLDASLRLLPELEVLDVSHNSIDKAENYLEYLTNLTRLNLGYNFIDTVPTFSLSVKGRLKTLVLRNNNLDNIEGVGELFNLEELDVTENCLSNHECLETLADLHKLNMICLQGNPISFHKNHRQLCLQHVSSLAVRNGVVLDGKKVTQVEIQSKSNVDRLSSSRRPSQQSESIITQSQRLKEREANVASYSFEDSDSIATSMRKGSRRGKKKKPRSRTKLLDESDSFLASEEVSTTDVSSRENSRAPSPVRVVEGQRSTNEDIEVIRDHYGVNWLQVMAAKNVSTSSDVFNSSMEKLQTIQNASPAPSSNQMQDSSNNLTNQTEDDIYLNDSTAGIQGNNSHEVEDDIEVLSEPENSETVVPSNGVMQSSGEFYMSEPMLDTPSLERMNSSKGAEWDRYDEQDTYYGEESEPFIILLPDEELHQLIVTVNQRYIIEKDLNGKVVEMLDLKCLRTLVRSYEEIKHQNLAEGTEMTILRMKFDYVRKDRRERAYIMEDAEFADSFEEFLKPFIEARKLDRRLKGMLQCLKCSEQFHDSEAVVTVQLPQRQNDAANGSNKDCSIQHKCPKCGSEMVVKLDVQDKPASQDTTPVGSYTAPSGFLGQVLSGKKSPVKQERKPEVLSSSPIAKSTPMAKGKSPVAVEAPKSQDKKEEEPSLQPSVQRPRALAFSSDKMSVSEISRKTENFLEYSEDVSKAISKSFSTGKNLNHMDNMISQSASDNTGLIHNQSWSDVQNALSNQKGRSNRNSTDSDISILTATSESSIAVISEMNVESSEGEKHLPENIISSQNSSQKTDVPSVTPSVNVLKSPNLHGISEEGEITPIGSPLSTSICSSMVSSVYENSLAANSTENLQEESDFSKTEQNKQNFEKDEILTDNNNGDQSIYDLPDIYKVSQTTSTLYMSCNDITDTIDGFDNDKLEITGDSVVTDSLESADQLMAESMETSNTELDTSWLSSLDRSCDVDYTKIDHNLKLYLLMNVLEDGDECQFSIRCDVVQYMEVTEYRAILVFTASRILVLRITSEDDSEPVENCMKCVENQPIAELQYIDIGLGYQSFRFEFSTECSSFSFLILDEDHCKQFINLVTNLVQDIGFSEYSKLQRISKYNETTMGNLQNVVWSQFKQDLVEEEEIFTLVKFLSGRTNTDRETEESSSPDTEIIGIVITDIDMSLVKENHQWPLPRLQAPLSEDLKGEQFTLKDRQKINNIATVEVCEETGLKLRITFFHEESKEEVSWVIAMETSNSVKSLINAVKDPWKLEFGVDLDIIPVSFADS